MEFAMDGLGFLVVRKQRTPSPRVEVLASEGRSFREMSRGGPLLYGSMVAAAMMGSAPMLMAEVEDGPGGMFVKTLGAKEVEAPAGAASRGIPASWSSTPPSTSRQGGVEPKLVLPEVFQAILYCCVPGKIIPREASSTHWWWPATANGARS
ncbi:hypothetical protein ZWY2020_027313 [Hordeum vulgare]|nr:hypothetical protein ZWY2020_027313 [Hordeum vulgare]